MLTSACKVFLAGEAGTFRIYGFALRKHFMKKRPIVFLFFFLNCCLIEAQQPAPSPAAVNKLVEDYMHLSRLGPGYSREMSQEIIDQFKGLFERDALLHWDLFRSPADSSSPPLTLTEYVNLAENTYGSRQPILDYHRVQVKFQPEGNKTTVRLEKTNQVMSGNDHPLYKNKVRLRLEINTDREKPLIRNIAEDRQIPFFSSLEAGINVVAWSNVFSALTEKPVILVAPDETYEGFAVTSGTQVQWGGNVDVILNRNTSGGILLSTGVFYSYLPLVTSMKHYSRSFPDTINGQSGHPMACTTFERAPEVVEILEISKIGIPLQLKSCLNDWMYLKAGTVLSFVTATSVANYSLSRTGGALVTDLSTHEEVYLDPGHELDQASYGYYRGKNHHFRKGGVLNKLILAIQVAAGFEKRFGPVGFGAEPNISFGINPISKRSFTGNYQLNDAGSFSSILGSAQLPAFEFALGFRFFISYSLTD